MLLPALERAASQAERAGKIISRIREFVKRSEPRRQRVAIGRIVDNAIGFAEIDARKRRIRIDSFVPSNAPDVLADPILIEQVLLNLLKNGLEAMERASPTRLKVAVILHEQHIEVAVVDRGHGLAEPERLFEPFFSTQVPGPGHGAEYLPYHYRIAPRPPVGRPQSRRRHHFPLYPALRCTPAAGPE